MEATESIEGARCALHPEREARGTCKRCGNFACDACDAGGFDAAITCVTCAETSVESRYHVVPPWRFVLLSVVSLGLYPMYWFYKTWVRIKRTDGSDIWPIPRAFFSPFTYFMLLTDINTQLALRRGGSEPDAVAFRELSTGLGIGYLALNAMHRLPDPYSLIAMLSVLCLLPAVRAIYEMASAAAIAHNAPWRLRHTAVVLVGAPLLLLAVLGTLLPAEPLP